MNTRGLIIGIVVVLAVAAVATMLFRNPIPSESQILVDGDTLTGGPVRDDVERSAIDPTEEYIRGLGPPDTSGLALLHDDSISHGPESLPLPGPPIGAVAPAFSLPAIDGGTFRLADARDHVIVLNFWATWCEPCRDEIPGLIQLQEDLHDEGLRVLGISIEENGREAVGSFTATFPFNYPLLIDGRSVAEEYGANIAVPTTVIVDQEGRVAARLYGAVDRDSLQSHVQPLLTAR